MKINKLLNVTCHSVLVLVTSASIAQAKPASNEAQIRQVVQSVLKEKDAKINQLEARIRELEHRSIEPISAPMPTESKLSTISALNNNLPSANAAQDTQAAKADEKPSAENKSTDVLDKIDDLKKSAQASGLDIRGFFDLNAKTSNSTDQSFSVGAVELDLDYSVNDKIGISTALILCGNSPNAPTSVTPAIYCGNSGPGGLSGGTMAGFSAALIDYHIFGGKEPPRGKIFDQHEMHIQGGRFDVPFGLDYQYFANKDRITITMPLTTSRLQLGGYSGDGVRTYGGIGPVNYTTYWTDGIYPSPNNDGDAVGGRLGFDLDGLYDENADGAELGFSHITEFDKHQNARNSVYGADVSLKYDILRWESEYMYVKAHQADETTLVGVESVNDVSWSSSLFQSRHQQGYNSTLIADLEQFVKFPILAFARFSRWEPAKTMWADADGNAYKINGLSMVTFGVNYKMGEHLTFKLEYNDSLNTSVKERYFDKRLGIGQVVLSF